MDDCIFCAIIAGEVSASIVYEDAHVIVFTDVRQPTEAHVLVVPKPHVETLDALPLDLATRLMQVAVLTARAIKTSVRPQGFSLWQSNGTVAGQEVPHVHPHLLTRQAEDGLLAVYPTKPVRPDRGALDHLAKTIAEGFIDSGTRPA